MKILRPAHLAIAALIASGTATAAPDEAALGSAAGYPVARTQAQAYLEPYRVGSFSHMDSFLPSCSLPAAQSPVPLRVRAAEPPLRYRFDGRTLTLDDYMRRQRATGLLVLKDGEIVAERYNYGRTAEMRMLSNSMAKTVTALGVMKALEEGLIRSLDDRADAYVPQLEGTLYGETRLVNLLRMAAGARYVEDYSRDDDRARFNAAMRQHGTVAAARVVSEREAPQGERFNYGGAQTQVLGLVLRAATGRTLCDYVGEKIWRPLGAEARATWLLNPVDQVEQAQGGFNATVRDYGRLAQMMADDGLVRGTAVIAREHLHAMTAAAQQPEAFRPGRMHYRGSSYYGYGFQVWLLPGERRRFMLLGIHGQAIFVDPALRLVVVHTAVGKDAAGDASGHRLGAERGALLRGIVSAYGDW